MTNRLVLMVCVLVAAGCATTRGTLDVVVDVPDNQASSQTLVIRTVTDKRVFEKAPSSADIPSLKGGEIHDDAITSRAIARKRNGYGAAMGDVLLPEGRTVDDLLQETLTKGFREQGYSVLAAGDPGSEGALEVDVNINKFWAWFRPGFWNIAMEFAADISINPHPVTGGEAMRLQGSSRVEAQVATTKRWMQTIDAGLKSILDDLRAQLSSQ